MTPGTGAKRSSSTLARTRRVGTDVMSQHRVSTKPGAQSVCVGSRKRVCRQLREGRASRQNKTGCKSNQKMKEILGMNLVQFQASFASSMFLQVIADQMEPDSFLALFPVKTVKCVVTWCDPNMNVVTVV